MRKLFLFILSIFITFSVMSQTTIIQEGFETAPFNFVSTTFGGSPNWNQNSTYFAVGTKSILGTVPASGYTSLTSVKFTKQGNQKVYLKFKHICKIDPSDQGLVRYIVNNGTPLSLPNTPEVYSQPSTGGYLASSKFVASSYPEWQGANINAIPQNSWWKEEMFDISSLFGATDSIEIQFRIVKQGANTEVSYGWLIDDVQIIGAPNEIFPPTISFQTPIYQDTLYGTGPWTVKAKIKDQSTIASETFFYRLTSPLGVVGSWVSAPMTVVNDSIFNFEIPSQPYSTNVEYYITAADQYSNTATSATKWFFNKRPPSLIVIQNDSTASSGQPNPFYQFYTQDKVQFIIKAEELTQAGVQAGPIQSISFNITSISIPTSSTPPAFFNNFYIKGGQTTMAATTAAFTSGLPTIYSAANLTGNHTVGWNSFTFTSPIMWDGTSNLIFETCFSNYNGSGNYSSNATIVQTNTTYNSSVSAYTDSSVPDLCSDAGTVSITPYTKRPSVKIGYQQTDLSLDASIASLISPPATLITSSISDVKVRIKNSGVTNLDSADVYWSLNGVTQTSLHWTGLLFQDQVSSILTLATDFTFPNGLNKIKVWVANPNNGVDLNHLNDTLITTTFVCGGALTAGTYTVGGASPDYPSLEAVQGQLVYCGISGPVVFNIRTGTYYSSITLPYIQGSSFANTITFKSETNNPVDVVIFDTVNTKATFYLDSCSHIRFNYLTMKANSASKSRVVELNKNARNIKFTGNIIEGSKINSTSTGYALVYSSKTGTQKDSLLTFENNQFKNGSFGLYLAGVSTNRPDSVIFTGNTMSNSYRSVYLSQVNGVIFTNNNLSQNDTSSQSYTGLYMASVNRLHRINQNQIKANKLEYGMYLSSVLGQTVIFRALISNNFIASNGNTFSGTGLYLTSCENLNLFYNTVNITGTTVTGTRAIYLSSGSSINVRNNILNNTAGGHAYYVSTTPGFWLSNYNDLFTNGTNLGYYNSAQYPTLATWKSSTQADSNSVNSNPYFTTWNDPVISEVTINGKAQPVSNVLIDLYSNPRSATTPDIGAVEFNVPQNDLAIIGITQPVASYICNDPEVPIIITIRNNGTDTIKFATNNVLFNASVDCSFNQSFSFTKNTGVLAPGATTTVQLTDVLDLGSPEEYIFKIWHEWALDANHINDTIVKNYNLTKITDYPYDVNFSVVPTPAFMVQQLNGTSTWTLAQGDMITPTLSPQFGTGRLFFNSAIGSGSISRIMPWAMDFSSFSNSNHPILEFWMSQNNAYTTYLQEGVTVRLSTDGGFTWFTDTLFAPRYNAAYTNPGWKRFEMDLSDYVGYSCVRIAFDARSQAGNNISIDRIVVRDVFTNDAKTNFVQTLGQSPVNFGSPIPIVAQIENYGGDSIYNRNVILTVTGANTYTETKAVDTLFYSSTKLVTFTGFTPTNIGENTIKVSVANDDNNLNNSAFYNLISTTDTYAHADTSKVFYYQSNPSALLLAKYRVTGVRTVRSVQAYIGSTSTIGKKIYGVVLGSNGAILAKSDTLTIAATDTSTWVTLPITNWFDAVVIDTNFYAGIAQIGTGYSPIGSQYESPVRRNVFYTAPTAGGTLTETTTKGRLMIKAVVGNLPNDDARLVAIINPSNGCGLGTQQVTLKISNNGINDILANTLTAWYIVDGGAPVSQVVPVAIPSGTTYNYSFTPGYDFSTISDASINFIIKAWINLPADVLHHNDTITNYNVLSQTVPPTAVVTSPNPLTIGYMQQATFAAANPGTYQGSIKWFDTPLGGTPIAQGPDFTSGNIISDSIFYVGFQRIDMAGYSPALGTGTTSNSYIPFYGYYNFGWSAVIYKKSEIGEAGIIDTVKFEISSGTVGYIMYNQKMYMKVVPDSIFSSLAKPDPATMTLVYDDDVTVDNLQWLNIPVTGGFNYDGIGHLLIYWENRNGDLVSGYPSFKATSISNVAKYKYQDSFFPETEVATMSTTRTNAKFYMQKLGCLSELTPCVVNVTNVPITDVSPVSVVSPISQCYLANETVTVKVRNILPTEAPAGTIVYCSVNGGTLLQGTIAQTIAPNATVEYTIPTTFNFASNNGDTPYDLKVWTSLTGDTYLLNDTLNYHFTSQFTALPLTFTDVTISYGTTYTFTYNGILDVYNAAAATTPIFTGSPFITPVLFDTTKYWMEGKGTDGQMMDITVGNGTLTNSNIPFYGFYNYGWSATLYKQSEIGGSGIMDTISFEINTSTLGFSMNSQKLYMAVVSDTTFANTNQPNPTSMTLVYDGDVTITDSQWLKIPLISSFNYNGSGSLMLYWENMDGDYESGYPTFKATTMSNVAKYSYSDASMTSGSKYMATSRTNIKFQILKTSCPSDRIAVTVNINNIPTNDITPLAVVAPISQCYLGNDSVKIRIKNMLPNIVPVGTQIYCQVNGGTILQGTLNQAIPADATIDYTIPQPYNFAANTGDVAYTLKVWTSLSQDTYYLNDTLIYHFTSQYTASPLTFTDVNIPYATNYTFNYSGVLYAFPSASAVNPISIGSTFTTPILYDTAAYWLEGRGANGPMIDAIIGNGAISNLYIPFYGFYNYGWSAAIYKASEIGGAGLIDTLSFQINTSTLGFLMNNQKMYLSVINDTLFANTNLPDPSTMTLAFSGDVTITDGLWLKIPVANGGFNYGGQGSLMVYWENYDGSYTSGYPTFKATTISNVAKYSYSDVSINAGSLIMSTSRTNIRFKVQSMSCPSDRIRVAVNVTGVPTQDAGAVSILPSGGAGYLSTTEPITVTIRNYGTQPISNFPVTYKVANGTPVTETYTGTIPAESNAPYTFTATQNLSNIIAPTQVIAYTSLTGDLYPINDTAKSFINPPVYCTIAVTYPASDQDIGNVTMANVYNGFPSPLYSNPTAIKGYTDFTQTVPALYLVKGVTYPFKATTINKLTSAYTTTYNVYVDYNKNASFQSYETMLVGSTGNGTTLTYAQSTVNGTITMPDSSAVGYTRMRVVAKEGSLDAPACGSFSYGEVEDYMVYIANPVAVDAALVGFVTPDEIQSNEGTSTPVKVKLTNAGTTAITTATIKLIHNATETTFDWTGNLASLQSQEVTIQTVNLQPSMNYFTAIVNMTGDLVQLNDTIRTQINALPMYDIKPTLVVNPTHSSCPNLNESIIVRLTNLGTQSLNMSLTNLSVGAIVSVTNPATYQSVITSGTIPANGTLDVVFTNTANFSTNGNYMIKAFVHLNGDGNYANDTIVSDTIRITNTVANIPITESFETFAPGDGPYPNGWEQFSTTTATSKYRWIAAMGQTLDGAGSGPLNDHTTGTATGKYVYAYSGVGSTGDKAQFVSRCYNFNRIPGQENEMTYWIHMFGAGMGKMYVEYGSGNNWTVIDSIVGQQQTAQTSAWIQKTANLNNLPESNFKIRFNAVKNNTSGNIALDDINLMKKLPDVGVTQIVEPFSYPQDSVAYGTDVVVKVKIKNFGNTVVSSIPVAFKPVNLSEVLETYTGTLNPGEEAIYTFTGMYVTPTTRTHSLCAYTKFPNDVDSTNNKTCKNVVGYQSGIGINQYESDALTLGQNIPNPANELTTIKYHLPTSGKVVFKVTDLLGQVLWIEELQKTSGNHQFDLNVSGYAPGMYYYTLEFNSNTITRKMTIH